MTTDSGHVITSGQPFTGNVNLKVSKDKTGSTVRVKDLNLPSSSTPFKNAPMAPRYPSCLRKSACWLPLKDHKGMSKEHLLLF